MTDKRRYPARFPPGRLLPLGGRWQYLPDDPAEWWGWVDALEARRHVLANFPRIVLEKEVRA